MTGSSKQPEDRDYFQPDNSGLEEQLVKVPLETGTLTSQQLFAHYLNCFGFIC